jgi:epoxyqueuosine reductase
LPSANSVIVAALSYRQSTPGQSPDRGAGAAVARYATDDYYAQLRDGLNALRDELRKSGYRGVVACDSNSLVDRAAAHRAGMAWWGRNTNLIIDGFGSWFVLGCVITDARFEPRAAPADVPGSGCGNCRSCIPACPTGALSPEGALDARRCLAWLLQAGGSLPVEFRHAVGSRLYGCDECQVVCPPNRSLDRREAPPAPGVDPGPFVDALSVVAASDSELAERFGRWYFADRDLRIWRRNATVVLGNWLAGASEDATVAGSPQRRAVLDALAAQAAGDDEMLAEHAQWALSQIPADPGCSVRNGER